MQRRGVEAEGVEVEDPKLGVPRALNRVVDEHGAELVVVCTHGRRGVRRAVLGSVAAKIGAECTAPVLLLRVPEA